MHSLKNKTIYWTVHHCLRLYTLLIITRQTTQSTSGSLTHFLVYTFFSPIIMEKKKKSTWTNWNPSSNFCKALLIFFSKIAFPGIFSKRSQNWVVMPFTGTSHRAQRNCAVRRPARSAVVQIGSEVHHCNICIKSISIIV